jgi:DNA-binding protein HU-beta
MKPTTSSLKTFLPKIHELLPDLPKKDIKIIVDEFLKMIIDTLSKEQKIHLSGIGTFQVRKTKTRMGRNPQTGEPLKIKASKKVTFRAAAPLKEKICSKKRC